MERNFIIMSTVLGVALGWFSASDNTETAFSDEVETAGDPPEDSWLGLSVVTASGEPLGTVTGARMSDNGDVRCLRIKSLEFAGDDAGAFPNFALATVQLKDSQVVINASLTGLPSDPRDSFTPEIDRDLKPNYKRRQS
ncbi:MAG: PRC-barrel domain-containing protein [Rhizobiaceae bacterium]|nr:PRC-barrel domain-containing protein [Rhizobiaceae bacterium]